ncbi:CBS domain-containing protein [Cellvibrio sp. OA-2007]|uniref:CBS domain-containing protein n=1 Tax=Cellvibrio sp. OA-2007 TaxID=529823 RepID=UPI00078497A6|nr:CBS domain-containing protein [Cellvibrio sp. OA-2007]
MSNSNNNNVTAKTIMSKTLLSAYEGWTIHRLAEFFIKHGISGAPVIASDHELVGVVTVSDIFKFSSMDETNRREALRNYYRESCEIDLDDTCLREWSNRAEYNCTVHQIMQREIITVRLEASVAEVAAVMVKNNIHRVVVVDKKIAQGVITSMDILRNLQPSGSELRLVV